MTILPLSVLKFVKDNLLLIILPIVFLGTIYFGYSIAYNDGVNAATLECIKEQRKFQEQVNERVTSIESSLKDIAKSGNENEVQLSKDIGEIRKRLKAGPVVVVKEGKCTPSPILTDSINSAISRANMK